MSAPPERGAPPLRVTILSSLPPQKGVTPYTLHLLHALAARDDVDVDALGFRALYPRFAYPGGAPEHDGARTPLPVPASRTLTWYNPLGWVLAGLRVRGDVLHAQWWSWFLTPAYATVIALARMRGKRVVVTVHNARPHEGAGWKRRLNDAVARQADQLIVHAERNREALVAAGFARERIRVVPMGPHALPAAVPLSREEARAALGLPPNANVVLLFGNMRPYKGIDTLIAAAPYLREAVPGLRIVIAGERWKDCREPREQAHALGVGEIVDVRPGYVDDADVGTLFAAADVVALPYTHFEAQSAAGALALSAGRAMVVSDVGGLPDLVLDARAVVPPRQPRALATALAAVLSDEVLRHKLERDAIAVREGISWERIADETVQVYRRVLGRRELRPARGRGREAA